MTIFTKDDFANLLTINTMWESIPTPSRNDAIAGTSRYARRGQFASVWCKAGDETSSHRTPRRLRLSDESADDGTVFANGIAWTTVLQLTAGCKSHLKIGR
jgi:hypothetical protein